MADMVCKEVTIVNRLGLHARAAAKLVTLASGFEAEVALFKDGREVDAKSIMSVMMLAAARNTVLEIRARGADAGCAVERIESLILERFGEAE